MPGPSNHQPQIPRPVHPPGQAQHCSQRRGGSWAPQTRLPQGLEVYEEHLPLQSDLERQNHAPRQCPTSPLPEHYNLKGCRSPKSSHLAESIKLVAGVGG